MGRYLRFSAAEENDADRLQGASRITVPKAQCGSLILSLQPLWYDSASWILFIRAN